MAASSLMVPLGTPAPDFALPDPAGEVHSLGDHASTPVVVAFVCNHCPYVKHIAPELESIATQIRGLGAVFLAINSNDADTHPEDSPGAMVDFANEHGWSFPYLVDEEQTAAAAYHAACTPDFFVYDADHGLVYRGQLDGSRPSNGEPVTGADLLAAAGGAVAGQPVPEPHVPSMGCSIKWKPGNEPD